MFGDNLDVMFCNMITYATSSVFVPIMKAMNIPVVLVALQPRSHLDYSKASTFMQLENDNICSVPEFTSAPYPNLPVLLFEWAKRFRML